MPEHDSSEVDERLSALVERVDEIIRDASENGSDVLSPSQSHTA